MALNCLEATGQWYAPSAVINDALIMQYIALLCTILHYLALSCTILHYLAVMPCCTHSYSQQMSPVIALDIAVVAQKVKVQY